MTILSWPDVELSLQDAVQLGRFLERLRLVQWRLARRAFVKPAGPSTSAVILAALGRTPLTRRELIRVTGLEPHVVGTRLSDLHRRRGLVQREADGTWRLVAGEEG